MNAIIHFVSGKSLSVTKVDGLFKTAMSSGLRNDLLYNFICKNGVATVNMQNVEFIEYQDE